YTHSSSTLSLFHTLFHAPPTSHIPTLSLHDALPIYGQRRAAPRPCLLNCIESFKWRCWRINIDLDRILIIAVCQQRQLMVICQLDRKSTRLNSSHVKISYAVFCLKKKKKIT